MKFLATFFTLAAIQTGVLAIYQPESGSTPWLYSKNERCKQALEHLSRSFLPLQANLNPEVLIARGNQQQQSNQARTALIEGAYESSQQAVQEFMRTTWGPLTDAQHKQQLTAAINQMVSSLQAVTRGCVGDCGGVVEVLQLAKNVQTAKQQMYTDCNVELPPEQNKKAEFKFSRFKISRSKK